MKFKYMIFLLLAVLLGACSDDEPEMPAEKHPSKAEFERIVQGKTWDAQDYTFIDSQGREMPEDFSYPPAPVMMTAMHFWTIRSLSPVGPISEFNIVNH